MISGNTVVGNISGTSSLHISLGRSAGVHQNNLLDNGTEYLVSNASSQD